MPNDIHICSETFKLETKVSVIVYDSSDIIICTFFIYKDTMPKLSPCEHMPVYDEMKEVINHGLLITTSQCTAMRYYTKRQMLIGYGQRPPLCRVLVETEGILGS